MVDVNGSWDVDTAIQQLKAWEPYAVIGLKSRCHRTISRVMRSLCASPFIR